MQLRFYQQVAVERIHAKLKRCNKVLLISPTGSGKTEMFIRVALDYKDAGKRVALVTRGRELVKNASDRLKARGVEHGVLMAAHPLYDESKAVQVCSIDTLRSRGVTLDADLIIIDEAHLANSQSFKDFIDAHEGRKFLSVTASPYCRKGLRHLTDEWFTARHTDQLIQDGFLVPPVYYCGGEINLSQVRVTAGDYNERDLHRVMAEKALNDHIVRTWQKRGEDRPSLAFCVTIGQSQELVRSFTEQGISAAHMDGKTPDKERRELISALRAGDIKVLSNVGVLTTGVDVPELSCLILARPTRSENLYIQIIGRGTRPSPGKKDFIVLDHANAVRHHGFFEFRRDPIIDPKPPGEGGGFPLVTACPKCRHLHSARAKSCPECGYVYPLPIADEEEIEELEHYGVEDLEKRVLSFMAKAVKDAMANGYKRGWIYYQLEKEFNKATANHYYWSKQQQLRELIAE